MKVYIVHTTDEYGCSVSYGVYGFEHIAIDRAQQVNAKHANTHVLECAISQCEFDATDPANQVPYYPKVKPE